MKIPMRPELPTACAVDNSASIQPARSLFILWGKTVQISGATSVSQFQSIAKFTLVQKTGKAIQ